MTKKSKKAKLIKRLAKKYGVRVVNIPLTKCDSADMRGIPTPRTWETEIWFDELSRPDPEVALAAYNAIVDREAECPLCGDPETCEDCAPTKSETVVQYAKLNNIPVVELKTPAFTADELRAGAIMTEVAGRHPDRLASGKKLVAYLQDLELTRLVDAVREMLHAYDRGDEQGLTFALVEKIENLRGVLK